MENLISRIACAKRETPVKVYIWENSFVEFPGCQVFCGLDGCKLIFGDWENIRPILEQNRDRIRHYLVESDRRFSALPLTPLHSLSARVEPGAILRQNVTIGKDAVIMMGAILNIGASVGERTMVDMGAVLGGGATVGSDCHIGAGAVLAGVIEPASATPVIVEDNVLIGANAVVIEGCRVGENAVVAAGAVVVEDVPANAVVAGCPAKVIKMKDAKTASKTALVDALREL